MDEPVGSGERPGVAIRNAVIHMAGEQPLLADLFGLPSPGDTGLLCTNLRTLSGTRPVFADASDSTFFFPYHFIRFVEIAPPAAGQGERGQGAAEVDEDDGEAELELDEAFLRRIREV